MLAQQSLKSADVGDLVRLQHSRCSEWRLPRSPDLVVTNPPWGRRLQSPDSREGRTLAGHPEEDAFSLADDATSLEDLQAFLKGQCQGILSSD